MKINQKNGNFFFQIAPTEAIKKTSTKTTNKNKNKIIDTKIQKNIFFVSFLNWREKNITKICKLNGNLHECSYLHTLKMFHKKKFKVAYQQKYHIR